MINTNTNINSLLPQIASKTGGMKKTAVTDTNSGFSDTIKALEKGISKIDDLQKSSDSSIKDLLAGKNEDITSIVSAVAEADMSFKLLVGVRNKLIEAYKQTMNMPL